MCVYQSVIWSLTGSLIYQRVIWFPTTDGYYTWCLPLTLQHAEQCIAISQEYLDEEFSFPKHHLTLSHTSPPLSVNILLLQLHAAQFLLTLPRCGLNGFRKLLFPWGYLCSLCWHLSYTNSRLHCCCHCFGLRNNITLRICFFFSPACLTVMHEEASVRSVGLLPLPTDTAITSGFVTAYRRSQQSWGFCLGDRCFSLILCSKWNHWTLFSYGSITPFFQFSGK